MGFFDEIAKSILAAQMMPVINELERRKQEEMQRMFECPPQQPMYIDNIPKQHYPIRAHGGRLRMRTRLIREQYD